MLLAEASKNYKFTKWTKGDEVLSTEPKVEVEISGDAEYYAYFEFDSIMYKLTFELNGGKFEEDFDNPVEAVDGLPVIKPVEPIKDGYKFDGWYIDNEFKTEFNFLDGVSGDSIVYAKWSAKSSGSRVSSSNSYKITTKIENGTIIPANTSVKKNNDQEFVFKADGGYEITDVLVDGKSVGVVESYKLEKVTAKHTIEVKTGKVQSIQNSSDWAKEEITKAIDAGLVPETFLKKEATKTITRKDFIYTKCRNYKRANGYNVNKSGFKIWN